MNPITYFYYNLSRKITNSHGEKNESRTALPTFIYYGKGEFGGE
jgi:hypothetical protein